MVKVAGRNEGSDLVDRMGGVICCKKRRVKNLLHEKGGDRDSGARKLRED